MLNAANDEAVTLFLLTDCAIRQMRAAQPGVLPWFSGSEVFARCEEWAHDLDQCAERIEEFPHRELKPSWRQNPCPPSN